MKKKTQITLLKAFRIDENTVKCLYIENETKYEFLIEWNNIHTETGEVGDYDLQLDCLSGNDFLNEKIISTIRIGESDNNEYLDLYLELRDLFDRNDCECI